jgi:quercetin 2,3-dioxygenase
MADSDSRTVVEVLPAIRTLEGDGFEVRRPFPVPGREVVDPFLLLDHMGPVLQGPGEAIGTPEHPHRGFETVTYLLDGDLEHRDSLGNHGHLGPGDTQWMTAGRGVIHQEGPSARMKAEGGRFHAVQLWVNLPRQDKMTAPAYQDLRADALAVDHPAPGVTVRVVAGRAFGLEGPGSTHTPISYSHVTLGPGARVATDVDADHTVLVYPMVGDVEVGANGRGRVLSEGELGRLGPGPRVELTGVGGGDDASEVLLLTGRPLHEPVARYGPFVMNTRAEIVQAVEDFQAGRFVDVPA